MERTQLHIFIYFMSSFYQHQKSYNESHRQNESVKMFYQRLREYSFIVFKIKNSVCEIDEYIKRRHRNISTIHSFL